MPDQTFGPDNLVIANRSILKMVSIVALSLLVIVAIYGAFFDRSPTAAPAQVAISNVVVNQLSGGATLITVTVRNIGTMPVSLTGYAHSSISSSLVFSPSAIGPGESSVGVARVSVYVANFDGSSGYVRVPNSLSLNASALTFEISFKYNGHTPDQQMIFSKGDAGTSSVYFYTFRSVNNVNDLVVYNGGLRHDQQLGNIFASQTWYTLDFALESGFVKAYVNGALIGSWTNSTFIGNAEDLLLGTCSCGGYYLNGTIGFFRIYGRSLTPSEIQNNYLTSTPVTNGLALWLAFNQTSGTSVADRSGNGNDGTLNGISFVPSLGPCSWYSLIVTALGEDQAQYSLSQSVRLPC